MDDKLQNLNLSEDDFKLIIDGLDSLSKPDNSEALFEALIEGIIGKDDNEMRRALKRKREEKNQKEKIKKEMIVEEIKILQGKLVMLKRYLKEQGALTETYAIINKKE